MYSSLYCLHPVQPTYHATVSSSQPNCSESDKLTILNSCPIISIYNTRLNCGKESRYSLTKVVVACSGWYWPKHHIYNLAILQIDNSSPSTQINDITNYNVSLIAACRLKAEKGV